MLITISPPDSKSCSLRLHYESQFVLQGSTSALCIYRYTQQHKYNKIYIDISEYQYFKGCETVRKYIKTWQDKPYANEH